MNGMPFEARKHLKWGPGENPVPLAPGDEVPEPVKRSLLEYGYVEQVSEVQGRLWVSQDQEAQRLWAESNGRTFLVNQKTGEKTQAIMHESRLVRDGEPTVYPPARKRSRPKVEAMIPVQSEPLGVAGDEPAPQIKRKRGRPPKHQG